MVADALALLAFMLGFTFGLATSRFDVRRGLVIDEANAIGTTSSRGGAASRAPSDGGQNDDLARNGPTTPTRAARLADASVDPTDAREATSWSIQFRDGVPDVVDKSWRQFLPSGG